MLAYNNWRQTLPLVLALMMVLAYPRCVESCLKDELADIVMEKMISISAAPELDKSLRVIQKKFDQARRTGKLGRKLGGKLAADKKAFHYKLVVDELNELKERIEGTRLAGSVVDLSSKDNFIKNCAESLSDEAYQDPVPLAELSKVLKLTERDANTLERQRQKLAGKLDRLTKGDKGMRWPWSKDEGTLEVQTNKTLGELYDVLVRQIADIILGAHLEAYKSNAKILQWTDLKYAKASLIGHLEYAIENILVSDAKLNDGE